MGYPIVTDRLTIAPLTRADVDAFVAYRRDPAVAAYQSWDPDYPTEAGEHLVATQPATVLPGPGEWLQLGLHGRHRPAPLLGDVAIHRRADREGVFEIGVTLAAAAQRQGLATEAVPAVVDLLAGHGATRVEAECDERNAAVIRLFARVGWTVERRIPRAEFFRGEWITLLLLARDLAPA